MPKAGMNMQEGTIIRWLKQAGDEVKQGEALLEIETDKVTMEVESPGDGFLLCRYFEDGAVVPVVTILGYVGEKGEKVPDAPSMAGGYVREREEERLRLSAEKSDSERAYDYHTAVIGGGPAGYTAALRSARMGMKTVLFERREVGGTAVNSGSLPLKTYISAAAELDRIRRARDFGIALDPGTFHLDFARLHRESGERTVSERLRIEGLLRESGVEVIREDAAMIGQHHIRAGQKTYRAENTILCGGSRSAGLDLPGQDIEGITDPGGLLMRETVPDRLVIVGGGVTGCEIAAAWNRFGSSVTVVEEQNRLIPTFDAEVSTEMEKQFRAHGIEVRTDSQVDHFEKKSGRPVLILRSGESLEADFIVLAVGRKPDLSSLGILRDQIDLERGKVMVDEYCRTSLDGVYACGDLTNCGILANSAMKMGEAAACTAGGHAKAVHLNRAPLLLYTLPEAAGIGLTESQARKRGRILIGKYPFSGNIRAMAAGITDGFVKVIADQGYGEILGVHIVGPMATELIVEAKTMMDMEITVYEVADIMHPHPTLSEAFMEACADAIGESLMLPRKKSGD